jgi:hypothetical protein
LLVEPLPAQRFDVEKPECRPVNLYGVGCGVPVLDQMKQILADLLPPQPVRALVKMTGETLHRIEIAFDGVVCIVAKPKFIDHSLS